VQQFEIMAESRPEKQIDRGPKNKKTKNLGPAVDFLGTHPLRFPFD
jgi:hypothetical protein